MQRYSEEFKRDAVALVRASGRPIAQIARELGVNDVTLGTWVKEERKKKLDSAGLPPGQEDAEMEENRRLKKRIAELDMEREILNLAVVLWVKELNELWSTGLSISSGILS